MVPPGTGAEASVLGEGSAPEPPIRKNHPNKLTRLWSQPTGCAEALGRRRRKNRVKTSMSFSCLAGLTFGDRAIKWDRTRGDECGADV